MSTASDVLQAPPLQPRFRLSKSTYLQGRQCPLRLWLCSRGVNEKSLALTDAPDEADDFGEQAAVVESYAHALFPRGEFGTAPTSEFSWGVAEARTSALLEDPGITAIFQAAFATSQLVGIADILVRTPAGWTIYEVKASSKMKPIFLWDLAFQWHLVEACGHRVVQAKVLYLNKNYVFDGAVVNPANLFVEEDCTASVQELLGPARHEIDAQLKLIESDQHPREWPGRRCKANSGASEGNRPSDCMHLGSDGECGQHLPENWSLRLYRLSAPQVDQITTRQLHRIEDLPADDVDFGWSALQLRMIRATQQGRPEVDPGALQSSLAQLLWPLSFIDFEYEPAVAVPRYQGMRPNQRLPFQWSLGIQRTQGEQLEFAEPFLHSSASDPRRPFVESLLAALPRAGSIIAHSRGAEEGVLKLFLEWFPGEYDQLIAEVRGRLFDTCKLAQDGYYHPKMQCSFSIKKLAPALLGVGYEDLAIQDGMAAVRNWRRLTSPEAVVSEQDRRDLLAYCRRDTELMHGILHELIEASQP